MLARVTFPVSRLSVVVCGWGSPPGVGKGGQRAQAGKKYQNTVRVLFGKVTKGRADTNARK